jgi:hypothetical protein
LGVHHRMSTVPISISSTHPDGIPSWITHELIALTLKVWQKRTTKALSREDAVIMLMSVGRLLGILAGSEHHEKLRRPGPSQQP